jgi:hypothetical protein
MQIKISKSSIKKAIKAILIEQTGGNGPDGRDLIAPAIDPNNVLLNNIPQGMKEASLASATNSEQIAIEGDKVGETTPNLNAAIYETDDIQGNIRDIVRDILNTVPTTLPENTWDTWAENKISNFVNNKDEFEQYKDYFEAAYLEFSGGRTLTWR